MMLGFLDSKGLIYANIVQKGIPLKAAVNPGKIYESFQEEKTRAC